MWGQSCVKRLHKYISYTGGDNAVVKKQEILFGCYADISHRRLSSLDKRSLYFFLSYSSLFCEFHVFIKIFFRRWSIAVLMLHLFIIGCETIYFLPYLIKKFIFFLINFIALIIRNFMTNSCMPEKLNTWKTFLWQMHFYLISNVVCSHFRNVNDDLDSFSGSWQKCVSDEKSPADGSAFSRKNPARRFSFT